MDPFKGMRMTSIKGQSDRLIIKFEDFDLVGFIIFLLLLGPRPPHIHLDNRIFAYIMVDYTIWIARSSCLLRLRPSCAARDDLDDCGHLNPHLLLDPDRTSPLKSTQIED